jgi:hypothetical protein
MGAMPAPSGSTRVVATLGSLAVLVVLVACGDPQPGGKRGGRVEDDGGSGDAGSQDAGSDAAIGSSTCADLTCDPLATCSDLDGTAECTCVAGLSGSGLVCTDVDECAQASLNACDVNAVCLNRVGTYSCRCEVRADDGSCLDFDECQGDTNTCHPNALCSNADDGFGCACDSGYTGDGKSCRNVNECAGSFTCAANADCVDIRGGYNCACDPRFEGDAKTSCVDKCVAALADTGLCAATGARCQLSSDGKADCLTCEAGFTGDGTNCTAHAGCAALGCGANTVCDVSGAPACACAPGYTGDPLTGCTDIDECAAAVKPLDCDDPTRDICLNTPGGYVCDCAEGFVRGSGACVGVNECASGAALCDPNAACMDDSPGYDCVCKTGFTGDGAACADVDECAAGTDNCLDDGTAECINTRGSFRCACLAGYSGDGVASCSDIDECSDPSLNDCDPNADCANKNPAEEPVGFTCACKDGFTGNGRECGIPNPCLDSTQNDCDPNAVCEPTAESFDCSCPAAERLVGDGKSCSCELSGRWAMRQDVHVKWNDRAFPGGVGAPIAVEGGESRASVWELHEYVYDGSTLQVKKKGCGSDTTPDFISKYYDDTYSSYVPDAVFDALDLVAGTDVPLTAMNAVPGAAFTTPQEAAVVGITLADPLNDPWPGAGQGDIPWDDTDGDGEPGLTLWPRGTTKITKAGAPQTYDYVIVGFSMNSSLPNARTSCTSVASRVITHMDAEIASCTRLTGEVFNDRTQARVHSCLLVPNDKWDTLDAKCNASDWSTATPCDSGHVNLLDTQDQQQDTTATFELVRIGEVGDTSLGCQAVRDALPPIPR